MSLNRETILAGVAGFALGLLAAWAVLSLPQVTPKKELPTIQKVTPSPVAGAFSLTLSQPEDGAISSTTTTQVVGKTEKGTTVIISGSLGDEIIEATGDGSFSITVGLEEGVNEIVVTAYSPDEKEEKTETRTVTYTKEEF